MIFETIAPFINVVTNLTFYRSLLCKRNTRWISVFGYYGPDTWDVPSLAARAFLHFFQVSQHPVCLDHSIQTRGSIWYFLNVTYVPGALSHLLFLCRIRPLYSDQRQTILLVVGSLKYKTVVTPKIEIIFIFQRFR